MNPEMGANEADVLEQLQDVREDEDGGSEVPPALTTEADPADVADQSRSVPVQEEDWPEP